MMGRRASQIGRLFKRLKWEWIGVLVLASLFLIAFKLLLMDYCMSPGTDQAEPTVEAAPVYIFQDGQGHPINWQALTDAWAAEAGIEGKRYDLTDAERWEVASVVTAEAVGEPFAGKVAVAQCILQASEDDGIRPSEALVKYAYAKSRPAPTEEAMEAVQAVFDFGYVATPKTIR